MDQAFTLQGLSERDLEAARTELRKEEADKRAEISVLASTARKAHAPTDNAPITLNLHQTDAPKPQKAAKSKGKAVEDSAAAAKRAAKEKAGVVAIVKAYKRSEFFKDQLKVIREPPASAPKEEWDAVLDECRTIIGSGDAPQNVKDTLGYGVWAAEELSRRRPDIFPLQLTAPHSLSATYEAMAAQGLIESEAQQLAIEYTWYFTQGPFVRLGKKMLKLMKDVDQANRQAIAQASAKTL